MQVWPQPSTVHHRQFSVAVSVNLNLHVTPTYFHQQSCRHFLTRAYDRLLARAFIAKAGDPPTYSEWNQKVLPAHVTATLPVVRLFVEPRNLLQESLLTTLTSWCPTKGSFSQKS